jgi:hypothetical protein
MVVAIINRGTRKRVEEATGKLAMKSPALTNKKSPLLAIDDTKRRFIFILTHLIQNSKCSRKFTNYKRYEIF